MAYKDEDVVYILTKVDVDTVAETLGMGKLTDEHYRMAQKFFESFCANGVYTWVDAIADGLREAGSHT